MTLPWTLLEKRLGKNIARRRKGLYLTQAIVAEILGVNTETISRLERGKYLPTLRMLERLAVILETDIPALLCSGAPKRPAVDSPMASWLVGLSENDQRFVIEQAQRQANYLRRKRHAG